MPNFISEDQIARALVQKLQHLHGFDVLECHTKTRDKLLPRLISGKLAVENLAIQFPPGMAEELNAAKTPAVYV